MDLVTTRISRRLRIGFAALFLAAVLAEVVTRGTVPGLSNALADVGLVAILVSAVCLGSRTENRVRAGWRAYAIALPAGIAFLAVHRSLRLPYLSDDWFHLAILGQCPTPWHAFGTSLTQLFLRPVGWCFWWCFARLSPLDGTLAHATCVALYMIDAVLVVPALRRCGASRGIAVGAAVCFAASPAASATVAWSANLYAVLSAGFSLAAIAWLPLGRGTAASIARTFALAALAYLSKEDAFVLPVLLFAIGARFQVRHISLGVRLAAPAAAALVCVLALRWASVGGIGGYSEAGTGRPVVVDRYLTGALRAAREEFPTFYFLPLFTWYGPSLAKSLAALFPLALLGLGGASPEARRNVPRALAVTLVSFAPILWALPAGLMIVNSRLLFTPSIGLAWIASALIAGVPFGRLGRAGVLALYVAASLVVGHRDCQAWEEAGRQFRAGIAAAVPLVEAMPQDARVLVYGLPEHVQGAPCFLNATNVVLPKIAGRPDVWVVPAFVDRVEFDHVIEVDAEASTARDVTHSDVDVVLAPGETLRFDLTSPSEQARCRRFDWITSSSTGAWGLSARGTLAILQLPLLGVTPGERIRIRVDASAKFGDRPTVPIVLVTFESGSGFVRQPVVPEVPFRLPPTARTLRVEVAAPMETELQLRGLTVESL